jgi:hypothetical protein
MIQKKKRAADVSILPQIISFLFPSIIFAVWRIMDDDEERRRYGDSTMLEPIIEQQDDEVMNWLKYMISVNIFIDDNNSNE